ncbi:Importin-7 [Trichoplax sp. H2]|nr:Importin-7 [Trichoplax sp. H2]|eukprot:RDD42148.1 Importin-7 [Trichoplax sp. H2]
MQTNMDPNSIVELLSKSLDPQAHEVVERELRTLEQSPGYPICLIQITCHPEIQMPIKQAGIMQCYHYNRRAIDVKSIDY